MNTKNEIVVTHRATTEGVTTTVEHPWGPPISKAWRVVEDGHYQSDSMVTWDEEDALPEEVQRVCDESATDLCRALRDFS